MFKLALLYYLFVSSQVTNLASCQASSQHGRYLNWSTQVTIVYLLVYTLTIFTAICNYSIS